jgi:signal transduction histidine kinase
VLGASVAVRHTLIGIELTHGKEPLWFLANASRLLHPVSGETTGSIMSWVDVTAMRNAELARVRAAVAEERQRVSRDLHDSLSNRLAAVIWQIEAIKNLPEEPSPEEIGSVLDRIKLQVEEALRDARRTVFTLNTPSLEEQPLSIALKKLVESMAPGPGIGLRFEVHGSPRPLDPSVATACLRIAQEAAGNALKHANASDILVTADFLEDNVTICVIDNGKGFNIERSSEPGRQSGFGLRNMRQRAEEINANLLLESGPSGTTVTLQISA